MARDLKPERAIPVIEHGGIAAHVAQSAAAQALTRCHRLETERDEARRALATRRRREFRDEAFLVLSGFAGGAAVAGIVRILLA